jgi:hypothetical protein
MTLASITYGSVNGGPFSGVLAVTVELSNKGAPLSTADVIDKILTFIGTKKKVPIRICGDLTAATPEEMFGFVKTLKDFQLHTGLLCDGQSRTSWMDLVDWLTVVIRQDHWLRFHCHELRYVLQKGQEVEPELPIQLPAIYIIPGSDVSKEDVFMFLKKARHPWGLILTAKELYTSAIWKARKE